MNQQIDYRKMYENELNNVHVLNKMYEELKNENESLQQLWEGSEEERDNLITAIKLIAAVL